MFIDKYYPLKNTEQPNKIDWVGLFLICGILFVSHTYLDILITARHGMNFWEVLFSGKPFDFYFFNQNTDSGNAVYTKALDAIYSFPLYLVFAVWNFPVWILEKCFSVDVMNSVTCLIWMKSMLLGFLFGSYLVMKNICVQLKMTAAAKNWCPYVYLSSVFVFMAIFVTSQYDIIGLLFILLGFLSFLKGDTKKFILWFAVAAIFKFYALIIFVPLLLLKEKRIIRILLASVMAGTGTLLINVPFILLGEGVDFSETKNFIFRSMLKYKLLLADGDIYLFLLLYLLLVMFCYTKKSSDKSELNRFAVYICFVTFGMFFVTTFTQPYWSILISPFSALLVFMNTKSFKLNLLVEGVMSCALGCAQMAYPDHYDMNTIRPMLLPKIFKGIENANTIYDIKYFKINMTATLTLTVFVSGVIFLAFYNYPCKNEASEPELINRTAIVARLLAGAAISCIPIAGFFLTLILN